MKGIKLIQKVLFLANSLYFAPYILFTRYIFIEQLLGNRHCSRCLEHIGQLNRQKSLHPIYNSQEVEANQTFINGLMDKQNVTYTYDGLKKEGPARLTLRILC